jgi:phosphate/sulfate permease
MKKTTTFLTLAFLVLACGLAFGHGHGHVKGTVAAVTATRIDVTTKNGNTVSVPLTAATLYLKGKAKATRAAVHVGKRVVVHLGAKGEAEEVHLAAGK